MISRVVWQRKNEILRVKYVNEKWLRFPNYFEVHVYVLMFSAVIQFYSTKEITSFLYKAKTCSADACTALQYANNKCACMHFKVSLLLEILKSDHVPTKCFITIHFTFIIAESNYVGEWLWYRDKSGTLPSFSGGNNWIHF